MNFVKSLVKIYCSTPLNKTLLGVSEYRKMARSSHFIVSPETCVEDMLKGIQSTFPGLSVDTKSRVILYRKNSPPEHKNVGLISGGGSGHEPFAAGFVGRGMLTAAVAGSIFASPPPKHILTAIINASAVSPGGVLVLLMNYTGDRLNFGIAIERAKHTGINIKAFVVDEDCAIDSPKGAGRRGLVGSLFVFKIAGGLALQSKSLEEIHHQCELVKSRIATLGGTLKACNLPGVGPLFTVEEGFMEVGVGIHGEAGAAKVKVSKVDETVAMILDKLCRTLKVKPQDKVCTIINNLGGISELELMLVAGQVKEQLKQKGVEVCRQYVGTLMSSLDMAGVQVSMLLLPTDINGKMWLDCLDAPTDAFAWPGGSLLAYSTTNKKEIVVEKDIGRPKETGPKVSVEEAEIFRKCLKSAAGAIKVNENKLNELDKGCGDGDCGSTLRRMADEILSELETLPVQYPQQCFTRLSELAEDVMGGTSGALYSLMFVGASRQGVEWTSTLQGALDSVLTYSKARKGDRTLFDALIPASESFKGVLSKGGTWQEALTKAVEAADHGCKETLHLIPSFGRASYVNASKITDVDAGAFGVTVWLHGVKSELL